MSCEENSCTTYFDGSFNVINYPKGSKLYNGTRFNREFPIGEEFYTPVDSVTPLQSGFDDALMQDTPISLAFLDVFNGSIKTGWYTDPISAKCHNCGIAAYVLKRDAIFIDLEKSEDAIKFIQPVVREKKNKQRNFLEWLCFGVDNEIYAGYTLGRNKELFFCNALKYLERDLTSTLDWQYIEKSGKNTVNKYLDQLKFYKNRHINVFAGNLYEQTVWTLLHLELILSHASNEYVSDDLNTISAAAALVSTIGFLGGERNIQRQTDFIITDRISEKQAESYLLGDQDVPEFKLEGNKLKRLKRKLKAVTLLSQLGIKKDTIASISNIVKTHTVLYNVIDLYRQKPESAVLFYINVVKGILGGTPSFTFMYYLLVLSVASIKAIQPPPLESIQRSKYFPFVTNVPKKFRGGIIPYEFETYAIEKIAFINDILQKTIKQTDGSEILHDGQMWYKNRILVGKDISQKINSIEISQWKYCLSGKNSTDFRSKLGRTFIIGRGTFGQVYSSYIDLESGSKKIVIKEAILPKEHKNKLKPYKDGLFLQNLWPDEFTLLSLVKDILEKKQSPNFLNVYHLAACEGCTINTFTGKHSGICYTTFMEAADGDMYSIPPHLLTEENIQKSFIYQLMIALHIVQKEYGMIHTDIKPGNILYQRTPQLNGKFFNYVVGNQEYLVENTGYVFYLADFGVARLCKPKWSDYYGERNGMVKRSGDSVELVPITSKYMYYKDNNVWNRIPSRPLKWKGKLSGTRNIFMKDHDPESNIPVDLSNTQIFPSWQFNGDIQDIIKMVTGGQHSVQAAKLKGFKSVAIKSILQPVLTNKKYTDLIWTKDMAHQVLADEMMKKIYVKPSGTNIEIIDTFYII